MIRHRIEMTVYLERYPRYCQECPLFYQHRMLVMGSGGCKAAAAWGTWNAPMYGIFMGRGCFRGAE